MRGRLLISKDLNWSAPNRKNPPRESEHGSSSPMPLTPLDVTVPIVRDLGSGRSPPTRARSPRRCRVRFSSGTPSATRLCGRVAAPRKSSGSPSPTGCSGPTGRRAWPSAGPGSGRGAPPKPRRMDMLPVRTRRRAWLAIRVALPGSDAGGGRSGAPRPKTEPRSCSSRSRGRGARRRPPSRSGSGRAARWVKGCSAAAAVTTHPEGTFVAPIPLMRPGRRPSAGPGPAWRSRGSPVGIKRGSGGTRRFRGRGSAARPGFCGWPAPHPRRPAGRTPVRPPPRAS